jgi:hypothetical protein
MTCAGIESWLSKTTPRFFAALTMLTRDDSTGTSSNRTLATCCTDPKSYDLSCARIEFEPPGFQPCFDIDKTRVETVSDDCSLCQRCAQVQLQVIGILMAVDPMWRDDIEKRSRVEDV